MYNLLIYKLQINQPTDISHDIVLIYVTISFSSREYEMCYFTVIILIIIN